MSRVDKINAELQREIYDVLKNEVDDPRITEMFSVMSVDCDREIRHAKVFISVFSADEKKKADTLAGIAASAAFVRRVLSRRMQMRTVPELHFATDNSLDHADKINKILSEINKEEQEKK